MGINRFFLIFIFVSGFVLFNKSYCQNDTCKKIYDENGHLIYKGALIDGKMEGVWKFYDSLGNFYKIQNYKNDNPDGETIEYYNNGVIKVKGQFNERVFKPLRKYDNESRGAYTDMLQFLPIGDWFYYDSTSKLTKKERYTKKGKLIRTIHY